MNVRHRGYGYTFIPKVPPRTLKTLPEPFLDQTDLSKFTRFNHKSLKELVSTFYSGAVGGYRK